MFCRKNCIIPPISRGGAAAARVAHNHEVAGSSPAPATKVKAQPSGWAFTLVTRLGLEPATRPDLSGRGRRFGRQTLSQEFIPRKRVAVRCPAPATKIVKKYENDTDYGKLYANIAV
jgi:hypothetical protein